MATLLVLCVGTVSAQTVLDDFEDGDISEYGGDTGSFTVQTGTVYEGSYALEASSSSDFDTISDTGIDRHYGEYTWYAYYPSNDDVRGLLFGSQNENGFENANAYFTYSKYFNVWSHNLNTVDDGNRETFGSTDQSGSIPTGKWLKHKVKWYSNDTIVYEVYDGSRIVKHSGQDSTYGSGGIGWMAGYDGTIYFDYLTYESFNDAPSIDSVSSSPSSWTLGSDVNVSADVVDRDGTVESILFEVFDESGNLINETNKSYSSSTVNATVENFFSPNKTENYTVYVTAQDNDGAESVETIERTVTDETPPKVSYNPSTTSGTVSQDWIFVNVTATDNYNLTSVTEEFNGTNSTFNTNQGDYYWTNHTGLSDGSYSFQSFATDDVGNTGSTGTRSVTLDTISPSSSDNWSASGFVDETEVTVRLNASDNSGGVGVANISYRVNGGSYTTDPGNETTVSISTQGNNTLEYYATDSNGNQESVNTEYVALDATDTILWKNLSTDAPTPKFAQDNLVNLELYIEENESSIEQVFLETNQSGADLNYTTLLYDFEDASTNGWVNTANTDNDLVIENDTAISGSHSLQFNVSGDASASNSEFMAESNLSDNASLVEFKTRIESVGGSKIWGNDLDVVYRFGDFSQNGEYIELYTQLGGSSTDNTSANLYIAEEANNGGSSGFNTPLDSYDGPSLNVSNTYEITFVHDKSDNDVEMFVNNSKMFEAPIADDFNFTNTGHYGSVGIDEAEGKIAEVTVDDYRSQQYGFTKNKGDGYKKYLGEYIHDSNPGNISYRVWMKNSNGTYNSTDTRYWRVNYRPQFEGSKVIWDGSNNRVYYNYSDQDSGDVDTTSSPSSGSIVRTNTSATVTNWVSPFDWAASVTDFTPVTAANRQIDFTNYTDYDYLQDSGVNINESYQVVNSSRTIEVRGDAMNASIGDIVSDPSSLISELSTGGFDTTTAFIGNKSTEWSWSVDQVTETLYGEVQNTNKGSNTSTQFIQENKEFSNTGPTDFTGLTVFAPSMNGTVQNGGNQDISLNGGQSKNVTYRSQGDFLENETSYDFNPQSSFVTLGVNYIGERKYSVANTLDIDFTDVNIEGNISRPVGCSQSTNENISINGGATVNKTIEFTCSPGTRVNGTLSKELDVGSDNHTEYYFNGTINVTSNETRTVNLVDQISKSVLTDFSERSSPATGYIDGSDTGVNVDVLSTQVRMNYSTDCCSSSPSEGLHSYSLNYEVNASDTSTEPTGGGGGGTPTSEDQIIYFGDSETSDGVEQFSVPFGATTTMNVSITNEQQQEVTAFIEKGDEAFCSYVSVQQTFESNNFGATGTYDMPAAQQTLGTVSATESFEVRFDVPNRTVLENQGVSDYSCSFETSSSFGQAEPLVMEVNEGFDLGEFLSREYCVTGDELTEQFIGLGVGEERCFGGPSVPASIGILFFLAVVFVNREEIF